LISDADIGVDRETDMRPFSLFIEIVVSCKVSSIITLEALNPTLLRFKLL